MTPTVQGEAGAVWLGKAGFGTAGKLKGNEFRKEHVVVYQWKDSSRFPVKAQIAGETLMTIRLANGGHLTPEAVVDASRPDDAPLHRCFEWDAAVAQEKYNKHIARNVIHSIVEVHTVEGEDAPKRLLSYIHVNTPETGNCYMTTARVMSDADLKEQATEEALKLLRGVQARFAHIEELTDVFGAIDRAAAKVAKRHRKVAEPRPAVPA